MKDTTHDVLNDYVARLKKESLLKSLLCSLAVGFGALLLTALICWFTEFSGYWIFAIAFLVPFGAAMPLFHFYVFYPTKKYVAKRLDKLGLDERILTMVEFENQDSYIMQRQRADAVATLSKMNSKLVKFALSAALIAVPAVAIPTATAMTSVYALSEADVLPSGKDLIAELQRDKTAYEVVYKIPDDMKGFALLYSASYPDGADEITLTVGKGQNGETVMAKPVDPKSGYVFVRWADANGDFLRSDSNVQGKIVVTPVFEENGYGFDDEALTDKEGPDPISQKGDGNDNRKPVDKNDPSDNRKPWEPVNKDPNAGMNKDTTQFVDDGNQDYGGSRYQEAYENAMNNLNQSGGSDDRKGVASDYFESIKRD